MATINEKMTAIADAIRAKTGGTEPLGLDAMAAAISALETGGGLPVEIEALTSGVIASTTGYRYLEIKHNLGVVPNFILMAVKNSRSIGSVSGKYPIIAFFKFRADRATDSIMEYYYMYKTSAQTTVNESISKKFGQDSMSYLADTTAYMQAAETTHVFQAGVEYVWVCGKLKEVV